MDHDALLAFIKQERDLVTGNRPLRLRLGHGAGVLEDVLLPQRVYGSEAVCGGVNYRVLAVSLDAALPLKELVSLPAAIDIVTDTGGLRSVCGYIIQATAGDSDGGLASYQIVIQDVFAIMERRTNTRVFRNMNEVDIVRLLVNEWHHANIVLPDTFDLEVDKYLRPEKFPRREFTMQHNESDAAFIQRLLKRRGIAWYFCPVEGKQPALKLVLFNHNASLLPHPEGSIRFHRDHATEEYDTITSWGAQRTLAPATVTRHSWDYRTSSSETYMTVRERTRSKRGSTGGLMSASLDDYQVLAPHAGDSHDDLRTLGHLAMARHDYDSKCFLGEGTVRSLRAGQYFMLEGHPEIDRHERNDREFVVTSLEFAAQNNLPTALAERVERLFARSRWKCGEFDMFDRPTDKELRARVQFTAVRMTIPIVPAFDARIDLPRVSLQSAIVVGPKNETVYCDQLGRVKIRFPAVRKVDHQYATGEGASTHNDSAWVRVSSNWAGPGRGSQSQCGTLALPRVGTEVLVDFVGADPDKPVIVGQLYNDWALPPSLLAEGGLPANRYLSGIGSREINGSGANCLQFDDTPEEISARLASDSSRSELNLGFLTQPRTDGRGQKRGSGAELRSDAYVVARGQKGVLVSAWKPADDSLLSRFELQAIVDTAAAVSQEMDRHASIHSPDEPDQSAMRSLCGQLKDWEQPNGQEALVAVSAPSGIVLGTKDSVALAAEKNVEAHAAEGLRLSAGKWLLGRALEGIGLFAYKVGIRLIAAKGNIRIESHDGDIFISSAGRIRLSSAVGIDLQAPEVMIGAEGASAAFSKGSVHQQSSSEFHIKSPTFQFNQGSGQGIDSKPFPSSKLESDQQVILHHEQTGAPIAGRRYKIELPDGHCVEGITDERGATALVSSDQLGDLKITVYPDNA